MNPRFVERRLVPSALALVVAAFAAGLSGACSGTDDESEPACLTQAGSLDCKAAYGLVNGEVAPTFDELWSRTLQPTCGSLSSCHAGPNPKNGLALDVEDTAYADLIGKSSTGEPRVTAGDLKCGKFMVRLETAGQPWSMPPGNHLDEPTLCVIRHWVANGAKR